MDWKLFSMDSLLIAYDRMKSNITIMVMQKFFELKQIKSHACYVFTEIVITIWT